MNQPVKLNLKSEALPLGLILLSLLVSLYFYNHFPVQVPTHWNYRGEIDGWSNKAFAAFFFPLFNLALYLLFLGLPYLDPKKDRYQQFAKAYHVFKNLMIAFMTVIYFLVGLAGLGYNLDIGKIVPATIGILFLIIGNYLGKIKTNWFMGIRTPWTLSNDEVWDKTNRLGGKLFMLTGLFLMAGIWLPAKLFWGMFIAVIAIVVIIPVIYSFYLYKKLGK